MLGELARMASKWRIGGIFSDMRIGEMGTSFHESSVTMLSSSFREKNSWCCRLEQELIQNSHKGNCYIVALVKRLPSLMWAFEIFNYWPPFFIRFQRIIKLVLKWGREVHTTNSHLLVIVSIAFPINRR